VQSLITESYLLQRTLDRVEDDDERRTLEEDMTGKVRCAIDVISLLVHNLYDIDSTGMLSRYLLRDRGGRNEGTSLSALLYMVQLNLTRLWTILSMTRRSVLGCCGPGQG